MTDRHDDLDQLLGAAARDYNRPGPVPRERMWENIRAQRARRAPVQRPRSWRRYVLPAVAAAVLVIGILIGRLYERVAVTHAPAPTMATRTGVPDSATQLRNELPAPPVTAASTPAYRSDVIGPVHHAPSTTHHATTTPQPAATRDPGAATTNLAFRLAVIEHLAGTEALLTSFRDEAARGDVDTQITTWARKLLTTTRLLQTAATQQDPTMKRLLDDLELVLVQIAQYSPTNPHRAEELELIEHSIQRRGVIGKLRTSIPARLAPSGT